MATTLDIDRLRHEWKTLRGEVKAKWAQLEPDDLIIHGGNVEQFLNRLHKKTGEDLPAIESYLAELMYGSSSPIARHAVEARERLQAKASQAGKIVRRNPGGTMSTAVGVGLATGILVGLILRTR